MNHRYDPSECIARWGHPASIALMDPACQLYSSKRVPGVMGYRLEANHAHFEPHVENIIYVSASKALTEDALIAHCDAAIGFGEEIILNPTKDPRKETGDRASLLRRNCKQAIRHDVEISEYTHQNPAIERSIAQLGEAWANRRHGPQVYLQHVRIFEHRAFKRFFYAHIEGKIVGVLILNRLDIHDGWVISFSMLAEDAPHGTSEWMIVSALEVLGKENCQFFAIGTVPLPRIDETTGLTPLTDWCVRTSFNMALKLFHLEDRERYWRKFTPQKETSYLLLSKSNLRFKGVFGLMSALNAMP